MKKIKQVRDTIVPLMRAYNTIDLATGEPHVPRLEQSKLLSLSIEHLYGVNPKCCTVEIQELDDEIVEQIIGEESRSTFSFDIVFNKCEGLKCAEWRSKWEPTDKVGRPRITIDQGSVPAYIVYVDKHYVPVVIVNMYTSNFNLWAERIGLRGTMEQRTDNPSTHFVYKGRATDKGLVWFNYDALHHTM